MGRNAGVHDGCVGFLLLQKNVGNRIRHGLVAKFVLMLQNLRLYGLDKVVVQQPSLLPVDLTMVLDRLSGILDLDNVERINSEKG